MKSVYLNEPTCTKLEERFYLLFSYSDDSFYDEFITHFDDNCIDYPN